MVLGHSRAQVISLHQTGDRYVRILVDESDTIVRLDPNRIFTIHGVSDTILTLNNHINEAQYHAACHMASNLGRYILGHIDASKAIVAIHNNFGLSINTYATKPGYQVHASSLYRPNTFWWCYDGATYAWLQAHNMPVVYELIPIDDGSLGYYTHTQGWRYINLEVGAGESEIQERLVHWYETHAHEQP
jgi:hypothetical protein